MRYYVKYIITQISRIRNVHLGPETIAKIDFKLSRESTVSGRVLDPDKNPVAGVKVHISKEVYRDGKFTLTNRGETFTDVGGEYRFSRLDEGKYFIDVEVNRPEVRSIADEPGKESEPAMKLVHTFFPNATSAEGAAPVVLHTAEEQHEVNVRLALAPTHCISAKLKSAESAMAALWLPIPGGYRQLTGGQIGPEKRFRICGLGEGPYKLTLSASDASGGFVTTTSVTFGLGRRDSDLGNLAPQAGMRVSGRVLVDGAEPGDKFPDGISISLLPADYSMYINEALEASVSDSGSFQIPNVLGAEYWISVDHLPTEYYVRSATIGSHDARREPTDPREGPINIHLGKDGGRVGGTVAGPDRKPLADVDVALAPLRFPPFPYRGFVQTTTTDQNGTFRFKGVEPGNYKLLAISDLMESEIENPNVLQQLLSAAMDVAAPPNSSLSLTVTPLQAHPKQR